MHHKIQLVKHKGSFTVTVMLKVSPLAKYHGDELTIYDLIAP